MVHVRFWPEADVELRFGAGSEPIVKPRKDGATNKTIHNSPDKSYKAPNRCKAVATVKAAYKGGPV